jgi:hypothetical protein
LGGALVTLAAMGLCFLAAFTLITLALYLEHDPAGFVVAGFPVYLLAFPYFLAGFALFLEDYWMLFGIYRVFGWGKYWVKSAILRALE